MRRLQSLLLGPATALAAFAGAHAADLPNWRGAPAAEYVKVCADGDVSGFVIPGSDTCLRISGYVDAGVSVGKLAETYWPESCSGSPVPVKLKSSLRNAPRSVNELLWRRQSR